MEASNEGEAEVDNRDTEIQRLQAELAKDKVSRMQLERRLQEVAPILSALKSGGEKKVSREELLKAFVADPAKVLQEFVQENTKDFTSNTAKELASMRAKAAVNEFTSKYKGLTAEDEKAIDSILDSNPVLTNLGPNPTEAQIIGSLEAALGQYVVSKPEVLERLKKGKTTDSNLEAAKKAAGMGSKGGSAETGQATTDEFDEILKIQKEREKAYAIN